MTKKHNPGQLRLVFVLAHQIGLDDDELHDIAQRLCRVESLKELTAGQASRLINHLRYLSGEEDVPFRATEGQKRLIAGLFKQLEWDESSIRTFLENHYGISSIAFIPNEKVQACITALKSMVKRRHEQEPKHEKPTA